MEGAGRAPERRSVVSMLERFLRPRQRATDRARQARLEAGRTDTVEQLVAMGFEADRADASVEAESAAVEAESGSDESAAEKKEAN